MRALLIIDMQLGSFRPYELRLDTIAVIDRINRLSDAFRNNGDLVIFIQHDGTKENSFMPGTEEWSLLPELIRGAADIFVSKTANDSFYKTDLQTILRSRCIFRTILHHHSAPKYTSDSAAKYTTLV
ncbi:isochorismatase family protein [Sphingobacterium siyangense]|uniref:isochorismatase family protein n=1 Tax=Sphingobacterium siyangense TaxID=459529 RepID=UPI0019634336|nr:isochorismatase family protein [Sphingobacterium siyangense]QRY59756.1 isochorismatase family protein [Sphingobacterium siyangense]